MTNELIGFISSEDELGGVIENKSLEVNVTITETGGKGDPGYTPIKGIDYFDGKKGDPGTTDYNDLQNKPSIESVELDGNKSFEELGLKFISLQEIDNLL